MELCAVEVDLRRAEAFPIYVKLWFLMIRSIDFPVCLSTELFLSDLLA